MISALHDYASTKEYLYGLKIQGLKLGIDRMRLLAAALGHPERCYPCIHVAGTNGKGSVSAMLRVLHRIRPATRSGQRSKKARAT